MFGLGKPHRPKAVAFDMVGTLMDLEPLRSTIVALGLAPAGLEGWIAAGLRDAFALTATGTYAPFEAVLEGALEQVLFEQRLDPPASEKAELLAGLTTLPAREGASVALSLLKEQGIKLIAFTNSSATAAKAQLKSGHLDAFMSEIVSTGEEEAFKPSRSVYLRCAEQAEVDPGELMLVAAHPWDIHGAAEAGLSTAYLSSQRPMTPVMHQPQLEAADLRDLAEQICQLS